MNGLLENKGESKPTDVMREEKLRHISSSPMDGWDGCPGKRQKDSCSQAKLFNLVASLAAMRRLAGPGFPGCGSGDPGTH